MDDADFATIEEYLGEPVPERYRTLMADWPLDPGDPNTPNALPNDAGAVLTINDMMRDGGRASEWPPHRFVIGQSPCGDSYYLDLTGASPAVFVAYHDADVDRVEAPDLDAFVAQLKAWEAESARLRTARQARPRRSLWPFGRRTGGG